MGKVFRRRVVFAALVAACGGALLMRERLFPRLPRRPAPRDIAEIRKRVTPGLADAFERAGLRLGAPVFMRIFKEERMLELWVQAGTAFRLFRSYPICNYSGDLGPKLREGDRQSPEGFYFVGASAMNPNSSYHLSFNLGFPNAYDREQGRTGSYLMVHGDCLSIGCYAMTDPAIEEIYLAAEAALAAGQPFFRVHAFPFRMTAARMRAAEDVRWEAFWANLKTGYDAFEDGHVPPDVRVRDGIYHFVENT